MTKLELTATILAGICANPTRALQAHSHYNVALAIEYANELLDQLANELLDQRANEEYKNVVASMAKPASASPPL